MPAFKTLRDKLAEELSDVLPIPVSAAWPKDFTVPCVYFAPPLADTYVTRDGFGTYRLFVDLVILVPHDEAGDSLERLEHYLEIVLINTADWELGGVDAPAPISVTEQGADYLGAVVHLAKSTAL